jgi:hypothetical protein
MTWFRTVYYRSGSHPGAKQPLLNVYLAPVVLCIAGTKDCVHIPVGRYALAWRIASSLVSGLLDCFCQKKNPAINMIISATRMPILFIN